MNPNQPEIHKTEEPLTSWKEIGAYLQRNEATARRWEREEGLPVHRHPHKARSSVYAYPSEIDAWRAARRLAPEPARPPAWRRHSLVGLTAALCLVMVGNGVRPKVASAQQPQQTTRKVWEGSGIGGHEYGTTGTISANGRYLSLTDAGGDLAVRDLVTGTSRKLTSGASWDKLGERAVSSVISRDGSQIAYSWFMSKDASWELRILPASGSTKPRTLFRGDGAGDAMFPVAWTPDRSRLLVYHARAESSQIGMMSVADGSFRALKSAWRLNRPRLSPDGKWVAYGGLPDGETRLWDVYVLATDGSQETDVVPGAGSDVPIEWSPDGSRLYFRSNRAGGISLWEIPMRSGKATGPAEIVRRDMGAHDSLGMTTSGDLFYVLEQTDRSNVYMAELGPNPTPAKPPELISERFVDSAQGTSVAPDGKSLAYLSIRPGLKHVVIVRTLSTGKEVEFHTDLKLFGPGGRGPLWFPDGQSLLVATYDEAGERGFARLKLPSGETTMVHRVGRFFNNFALSPDGRSIFYTESSPDIRNLVRYDLESRKVTSLSEGKNFLKLSISPDGARIAYRVRDGSSDSIIVMPSAGGLAKEIHRAARISGMEWTRDGKFLLFVKLGPDGGSPSTLWRLAVESSTAEPLGLAVDVGMDWPTLHPDGKRLFYTSWQPALSEIWKLENFSGGSRAK